MPEKNTASYSPPQVTDKRIDPPGVLPKNAQALVIAGLALAMLAAMWLSGGKTPKQRPAPTPVINTVMDPNAFRIQEYKKRIEEGTQRLEAEQAQLVQHERALGGSVDPSAPIRVNPGIKGYSGTTYPRSEEVGIRAAKEKREHDSLSASNVALTFRKDPAPVPPMPQAVDESNKALSLYTALAALQANNARSSAPIPPAIAVGSAPTSQQPPAVPESHGKGSDMVKPTVKLQRQEGDPPAERKMYRVMEGVNLDTVLTNRLDSSFSGPVNCMVTTDIYSHDGRHLLVPQGSRVLGEVRKIETFGEQRLAVTFHRLIMPDHYSIDLDKFQGLNQIGETGLRDQVNHHYLQVFGVSLAIGAIAGLGESNSRTGFDRSAADAYEQGVATSLSQSSLHILDRYLNVLPTYTIREGHRVKVFLSEDLWLPAYDQHPISND